MKLCMGCMSDKGDVEICPNCGLNENDLIDGNSTFLTPGTELNGRYIIGIPLGQGGFGITYMGYDKILNTKVAVKEYYPSDIASRNSASGRVDAFKQNIDDYQKGKERFLQEARTLAKFADHPCIVGVKDCFDANDTAYMIMEFLDGVSLKEYLKRKGGKLSVGESISLLTPVMDALKAVHSLGIIHRDISPDNIFITTDTRVRLIDFGAARQSIGGQKSLSVMLKPGYAPEEQYRTRGNQGPWTDVYALTATLYRMITGCVPPDSLERVMDDTLEIPMDLPENIRTALSIGLAVRAPERYSSVSQLQKALLGESVDDISTRSITNDLPDLPKGYKNSNNNSNSGINDNNSKRTALIAAISALSVVVVASVIFIVAIAVNPKNNTVQTMNSENESVVSQQNTTATTDTNTNANTGSSSTSSSDSNSSSNSVTTSTQPTQSMGDGGFTLPDLYSPSKTYKGMTGIENSVLLTDERQYYIICKVLKGSYEYYAGFVHAGRYSIEEYESAMYNYMYTYDIDGGRPSAYQTQWKYFNDNQITYYRIDSSNVKSVRKNGDTYYAWVTETCTEEGKKPLQTTTNNWVYRLKDTDRGLLIFDYTTDPVK